MSSIFYEPCLRILKEFAPNPSKALKPSEVRRKIIEKYPNINWCGGIGPIRWLLIHAAEVGSPIKQVPQTTPPRFYYFDEAKLKIENNKKTKELKVSFAESEEPDIASPEEIMEEAYSKVLQTLKKELLTKISELDPQAFEDFANIVVGTIINGRPVTTAPTRDKGIDGYIYGDVLGINVVCVQAKHYKCGCNVQRPDIQRFCGALHGLNGVFVTSSSFSDGAKEEAEIPRGNSKVILIDAKKLVDLMIDLNIGVEATSKQYILKRVNTDFFEDFK